MAGESARSGVADEKRYRIIAWWAREGRERNRVPPWLMSKFRLPMPEIQRLDSFQCTRVLPCAHRVRERSTSLLRIRRIRGAVSEERTCRHSREKEYACMGSTVD